MLICSGKPEARVDAALKLTFIDSLGEARLALEWVLESNLHHSLPAFGVLGLYVYRPSHNMRANAISICFLGLRSR